jgi:hypothetical protein
MRSTAGERPTERPSSPSRTEEGLQASTSPRLRAPLPTLIGVAPAAPIVSGRPEEGARLSREDVLDTVETPVLAPWRPQDAPTVRTRRLGGKADESGGLPPVRGPKHTLDAISIGDLPVTSRRRGRTAAAAAVTVVAAIAMVLIGRRVSGKPETSAGASAAPAAQTSPRPASEPPPAPANAADQATLAAAAPSADLAASRRASVAPAKSKHAKPAPHHKHAPPAKPTN